MNLQTFFWRSTQQLPSLPLDYVHVFAWNLDLPVCSHDWVVLSEEETLRARHFVFPRDRDRFVRSHSTMRALLGWYSTIAPAELLFSKNEFGKPQIQNTPDAKPLHFNLSHSGGIAVLAVAHRYRLGIDVEIMRSINVDIADHHFSNTELKSLRSLAPEQWLCGFYRCWTSKEALLKGVGHGLNLPLDGFDVEADPRRVPALLASRLPAHLAPEWLLFDLRPAPSVVGTLAISDETGSFRPDQLRCFSFEG